MTRQDLRKPETTYHVVENGKSIKTGTKEEVEKYFNTLDRNKKHFCWLAQTSNYHAGLIPMITNSHIKATLKAFGL